MVVLEHHFKSNSSTWYVQYILYFLTLNILQGCNYAEDAVHLIPMGYRGPVIIIFGQDEKGRTKEYEEGKRVYRIPDNGVLLTKFKLSRGIHDYEFYYVDKNGGRHMIPSVLELEDNQIRDSVYVTEVSLGHIQYDDPKCSIYYASFGVIKNDDNLRRKKGQSDLFEQVFPKTYPPNPIWECD